MTQKSKYHILVAFILLAIGLITYSNSLRGDFMMDDESFFDERMKNIKFLYYNFIPDKDQYLGINGLQRSLCYRPLNDAPIMVLHLIFNDNPFGYHVASLLLYCLASFLIYLFCFTVFRNFLLAVLTSIFYLVHPINGVAVNHIVALGFPLQVIFMTLSLLFFWRAVSGIAKNILNLIISSFCYIVAILCHETAMFLPFYALCLLWVAEKNKAKEILLKSIPLFIIFFLYFLFRLKFSSLTILMHNLPGTRLGFLNYIASLTKLISWYMSQLIYPKGIVLTWVTSVVKENLVWWLGLFFGLLGFFAYLIFYYRVKRTNPAAVLGLSWFFFGFVIVSYASGISPKAELVMEPHWFIFSSVGFFLFLASIILPTQSDFAEVILRTSVARTKDLNNNRSFTALRSVQDDASRQIASSPILKNNLAPRPPAGEAGNDSLECSTAKALFLKLFQSKKAVMVFLMVCLWIGSSRFYNGLWANEFAYYQFWLEKVPGFHSAHYFCGRAYLKKRQLREARYHYMKALSNQYVDHISYSNLGLINLWEGNIPEAKKQFFNSLKIEPRSSNALNSLGVIYVKENNREKAREFFNRAIAANRFSIAPRKNLGHLYLLNKDTSSAITTFTEVIDIVPHEEEALINLMKIYAERKDQQNTLKIARELSVYSRAPGTLAYVASIFGQLGLREEAGRAYQRSLEINSTESARSLSTKSFYIK